MATIRLLSPIRSIIREYPALIGLLAPDTVKAIYSNFPILRAEFFATVYDAVENYLLSSRPFTTFKNAMNRIIATGFLEATEIGYEQAGAELPLDPDTQSWLASRIDAEMGYVQGLFSRLSQNKQDLNAASEAYQRAVGYTKTLDAVYGEAKLRGSKNKMVTWQLGLTEKHCPTCSKLHGQRHRATWFFSRGYIPRKPGAAMTCKGYNCDCRLLDDMGYEYVIRQG